MIYRYRIYLVVSSPLCSLSLSVPKKCVILSNAIVIRKRLADWTVIRSIVRISCSNYFFSHSLSSDSIKIYFSVSFFQHNKTMMSFLISIQCDASPFFLSFFSYNRNNIYYHRKIYHFVIFTSLSRWPFFPLLLSLHL